MAEIKVSDEVLAILAINATTRTEGVYRMAGTISNTLNRSLLGKDLLAKGVKISQSDMGVVIDIFVIIKYGYKIPEVAWDIQKNVKDKIVNMIGGLVSAVNIHVQGVGNDDKK